MTVWLLEIRSMNKKAVSSTVADCFPSGCNESARVMRPKSPLSLIVLSDVKMPWFGSRTGYERLVETLPPLVDARVIGPHNGFINRCAGRTASLVMGHERNNSALSGNRMRAAFTMLLTRRPIHILYGEAHLPEWSDYSRTACERTILTLHQPLSWWTPERLKSLKSFCNVILLSSQEESLFARHIKNGGKLGFIRHGVDTQFFQPGIPSDPPILLYSGVHLRNVAMFTRIARRLMVNRPEIRIDALVPASRRTGPHFEILNSLPNIRWQEGLNDESLKSLYQRSHTMLLPMNDSSANTSVVEALACGLPIVTTDVGGIRDYGGGSIYPVVPNNDDDAMLELIERYLSSPEFRKSTGVACREFAVRELNWERITAEHASFYREVWG